MTKDTGGPAFPGVEYKAPVGGGNHMMTIVGGMTLRDYFAAKAMQGIVSILHQGIRATDIQAMCGDAYAIADAMLKARD